MEGTERSPSSLVTLLAEVGRALATSGLPARRLEPEIAEPVLLKQDRVDGGMLAELHRPGLRIAMDGFGKGDSSPSHLRSFPSNGIRTDQSFVRNLFEGEGDVAILRAAILRAAILRAAIGLGLALGMTVLAEGVETEDQRGVLLAEGCHELQGCLFGRPKPLSDIRSARAAA